MSLVSSCVRVPQCLATSFERVCRHHHAFLIVEVKSVCLDFVFASLRDSSHATVRDSHYHSSFSIDHLAPTYTSLSLATTTFAVRFDVALLSWERRSPGSLLTRTQEIALLPFSLRPSLSACSFGAPIFESSRPLWTPAFSFHDPPRLCHRTIALFTWSRLPCSSGAISQLYRKSAKRQALGQCCFAHTVSYSTGYSWRWWVTADRAGSLGRHLHPWSEKGPACEGWWGFRVWNYDSLAWAIRLGKLLPSISFDTPPDLGMGLLSLWHLRGL